MLKKEFISLAQIIQPGLSVRRSKEPVLWAFSMTKVSHVALKAISRKLISLVYSEIKLSLRFGQIHQRSIRYVTKEILWINKMVA